MSGSLDPIISSSNGVNQLPNLHKGEQLRLPDGTFGESKKLPVIQSLDA
jgi:hypothetical protein